MPKIFPPIYMLLFASLMSLLDYYLPIIKLPNLSYFAYILITTGLLIDSWSLVLFIKSKTNAHPLKLQNTQNLVTSGTYKITRNPMYLGLLLVLSGWWLLLKSLSPVIFLPLFVILINKVQIEKEEQVLIQKFGQDYLNYQKKVHRWF